MVRKKNIINLISIFFLCFICFAFFRAGMMYGNNNYMFHIFTKAEDLYHFIEINNNYNIIIDLRDENEY